MTHARTAAAWAMLLCFLASVGLFGSHVAKINTPNPSYEAEQAERAALRSLLYEVRK